jgi:hypothetical protein
MTPATVVESPTRIRILLRSTIREQAAKLPNPGRPIEVNLARVQEAFQNSLREPAPELERWIVADRQVLRELQVVVAGKVPRRWIVADSRVPLEAWTKGAMQRWRVIVASQAAKACLPHNREVAAVSAVVVAAVAVAAAAAEEDKEGRI